MYIKLSCSKPVLFGKYKRKEGMPEEEKQLCQEPSHQPRLLALKGWAPSTRYSWAEVRLSQDQKTPAHGSQPVLCLLLCGLCAKDELYMFKWLKKKSKESMLFCDTGREGDDRRRDGWMASPTQWTWIWASSGRRWRIGKPGVLVYGVTKSWTRLSGWITTIAIALFISFAGLPK